MKQSLGLLILMAIPLFFSLSAQAQKEEKAHSILEMQQVTELNEDYSINLKTTQSLLILNKDGLGHGVILIHYDKLRKIQNFEATISSPLTGKVIKKLKLKDLNDVATISDISVMDDSRVKYFEINTGVFPIKVETSLEMKYVGNYYMPTWQVVPKTHQKVLSSSLELIYPESLGIRYKTQNINVEPETGQVNGKTKLKWTLENLDPQPSDIDEEDDLFIRLGPKKFSLEGYASEMDSWEGLAKWQSQLNKGKDELPGPLKAEIKSMVVGLESPEEKIARLYRYLQENYRYVSIQLGIGGWMPTGAAEVYKYKYGDCKGLSNLMMAILKEAGVPSNYTIVRAGQDAKDIDVDFPSNQFNHIILKVPLEGKDPVWLECTSTLLPPGFLGDFTMNRHVLVVTEDGGYLDKTPDYSDLRYNTVLHEANLDLDDLGNARIKGSRSFQGLPAQWFASAMQQSETEKKKYVLNKMNLKGLVIDQYELNVAKENNIPSAEISYQGIVQQYFQNTAKRIMIQPQFEPLETDMLSNNCIKLQDRISIKAHRNLEPEAPLLDFLQEEENYKSSLKMSFSDNTLTMDRTVEINFPEDMTKEDKQQVLKTINGLHNKTLFFKKLD
ncbi:transglutaminase-like domain-containing protein [Pararhodonellum marinum]|uniref:transglutaminase-like domain-containing protein n=1 Tax=Pararhodonellum marinum TaxID=2755358 RepID=UPI00188EA015|nr:transglutaminase-like domain-containing protein [Pararhodonellum marinum]